MTKSNGACMYIVTNSANKTLYTGVTSDLYIRMVEHRDHQYPKSFTSKYHCTKLVYVSFFPSFQDAMMERKRIQGRSRQKKIVLIESVNPQWADLWELMDPS
jgi:putative endonuclease